MLKAGVRKGIFIVLKYDFKLFEWNQIVRVALFHRHIKIEVEPIMFWLGSVGGGGGGWHVMET